MKATLLILLGLVLVLPSVHTLQAAEIWLDANGDGLPDSDTLAVEIGEPITVGIWIDSESFTWTNFLAFVQYGDAIEVDSAAYTVSGGGPFPIDDFSVPNAIGLGGYGYSESGVTQLGEVYIHATASGVVCVAPRIDTEAEPFSQLGADTLYALFATASSACLAATGDGGGDNSEEHDFEVPGQEPNWCHEIAFVKLRDASGSSFMQTASDLRATYGLRILLGIGPDGLICQSLPGVTGDATELAKDERVEFVTRDVAPTVDASTVGAVDIWNYIKTRTPAASSEAGETQRMPVNCLPERGQRTGEPGPSGEETLSLEHDAQRQTSVYMLGDVGLKVIFPESQASGGCPTENWTSGQITQVLGETAEALLFYSSYPMESLVSFFMPEPYSVTNTAMEPITGNHDANQWREAAMQQLGFGSGDHTEREFAFCNSKRQAFRTDWYYLAYVVNSACDSDGLFADGYFAFVDDLHRPAVIMTYDNDNWGIGYLDMVMRHEMGHVFGAADEYDADRCECGNLFGYLHVGNGNCVSCAADQDPCIMADASLQFSGVMCPFTLGQVGWRDTDGDGPFDPIDPNSGRNLLVGDTGDIVSPGDIIDIYTQSLDWVKRIAASERAEDGGGLVWDGLNYAGYVAAAPAIYLWQKNNGGSSYAAPLRLDTASPVLSNIVLSLGPYYNSVHTLTFDFEDNDTFSGRIRATATLGGSASPATIIFPDEFQIGTQGSFPPISRQFTLPAAGVYTLDLLVWDVGGGHNATYSQQFSVGGQTGVGESDLALDRALRPMPNPSRGSVRWAVWGSQSKDGVVLDVQGRVVRRLPKLPVGGEGYLEWDGRDDSGRRVSPGQYFVRVEDSQGYVEKGKVVILR